MNRTPLFDTHERLGAKMVDFGGWEMPVRYSTITEEHLATRSKAGLFDLSHMGRIELLGKDRETFIDRMTTARISGLPEGKGKYSFFCTADGGVIDDIVAYKFEGSIKLVVNAGNREAILVWLEENRRDDDVQIRDLTSEVSMIAIQGPLSQRILQDVVDIPLRELPYYWARLANVAGVVCTVSRTGYTGEDGFEIYLPRDQVESIWGILHDVGYPQGILPAGLGARDTLRLEAGMPLYGHELTRDGTPLEAGLGKFVDMDKEFVGSDALLEAKKKGLSRRLVGLEVDGKRIPRQGATIHRDGEEIGVVTSGTFSPSLKKTIALAYATVDMPVGCTAEVDIRGKMHDVCATRIPFYKREK